MDCVSADGLDFFIGWAAVYFRVLVGFEAWAVLVHDIDGCFRADMFGYKVDDFEAAGNVLGKDEVPNQDAAGCQASVGFQVADLAVHFFERFSVNLRVVRGGRKLFGNFHVGIFHVRHVNIYKTFEQLEHLGRIVAAGVVNCRQRQAFFAGQLKGGDNRRGNVRGRDEIDIAAAVILQFEHRLGQLLDCDWVALPMMADIEVLAEDTAQIAAGEENRAGTVAANQYAFLAEMGTDGTDARHIANAAKTQLVIAAMDFAPTGT